ncbi:unnamed protein product [Cuscuta europaea]|uniref:Uncharacterized protein n=1 Tax=Cuscuta europaea TaxID=41803 RepID=A0A9P0Z512_CUSEU|nr:unnamed protein product [Cuscuta europaea]
MKYKKVTTFLFSQKYDLVSCPDGPDQTHRFPSQPILFISEAKSTLSTKELPRHLPRPSQEQRRPPPNSSLSPPRTG